VAKSTRLDVILSGVIVSRSETITQSKNPYALSGYY
jgi:hypothetical protein